MRPSHARDLGSIPNKVMIIWTRVSELDLRIKMFWKKSNMLIETKYLFILSLFLVKVDFADYFCCLLITTWLLITDLFVIRFHHLKNIKI